MHRWLVRMQISKKYTHYGAIILFMYFGLRMLYDVAFGGESVGLPYVLLLSSNTGNRASANCSHKAQANDDIKS